MSACKQAVILAAGAGRRLMPLTRTLPKCLVAVGGVTILDNLLDILAGFGLAQVVIVTGHQGDVLRAHVARRRDPFTVRCIDNPDYATSNNLVSLWLAAPAVRGPFMLCEADLFIEPAVLAGLDQPDRMVVARHHPALSGTVVRLGAGARVEQLILGRDQAGLDLAGLYKTVNFYSFSHHLWLRSYRPALARFIAAGRVGDYYEAALGDELASGRARMTALDVTGLRWAEIDDAHDLAAAEALFTPTSRAAAQGQR